MSDGDAYIKKLKKSWTLKRRIKTMLRIAIELAGIGKWRHLLFGFLGLAKALFKRDSTLSDRRLAHCLTECPFADHLDGTCGHVGEIWPHPSGNEPSGCWCFLDMAARLPEKDCWARHHGMEIGWPDELRPRGLQ